MDNPFNEIPRTTLVGVIGLFVIIAGFIIFTASIPPQTARVIQNIQAGTSGIHVISIDADGFYPKIVYAKLGDVVRWKNGDSVPHTVTSDEFGSKLLFPGNEYSLLIGKEQEFYYFSMGRGDFSGQIIVVP